MHQHTGARKCSSHLHMNLGDSLLMYQALSHQEHLVTVSELTETSKTTHWTHSCLLAPLLIIKRQSTMCS